LDRHTKRLDHHPNQIHQKSLFQFHTVRAKLRVYLTTWYVVMLKKGYPVDMAICLWQGQFAKVLSERHAAKRASHCQWNLGRLRPAGRISLGLPVSGARDYSGKISRILEGPAAPNLWQKKNKREKKNQRGPWPSAP